MVSNILNNVSDDVENVYQLIAGLIGEGTAIEFRSWNRVYDDLPKIEDIFAGNDCKIPTNLDSIYALCSSMVAYAREHKKEMEKIANSIRYADKLPPDFSVMLLKDYMAIEKGYKEKLLKIPEFSRWLASKGRLLNDNRR
jgi:hypothetical protein